MRSDAFRRILLKLSGEALCGRQGYGISEEACLATARAIKALASQGAEVGVVIGAGNIFRGIQAKGLAIHRASADQMGMLATIINGKALQQTLLAEGCPAKLMSGLDCPQVAERFNGEKALEELSMGKVMIFAGGTGSPYFTTDTAAALRAIEIRAGVLLKATKVDGIYDKDPLKFSDAVKYDRLSYSQALAEKLEVMDATAIAMCRSGKIPVLVFNMSLLAKDKVLTILSQGSVGTWVEEE